MVISCSWIDRGVEPRTTRKTRWTPLFAGLLIVAGPTLAFGQDYGSAGADVPGSLCEAGAKLAPVLVKDPVTGKALGLCDGLAIDPAGNIFVSEPGAGTIYKVGAQGASVYYSGHNDSPNGLDIDPQGRLVAAVRGAILRFKSDGTWDTLAASGNGIDFKALKNLCIASSGAMMAGNGPSGSLFHISADGKTVRETKMGGTPNGIQWIEEKKALYVADMGANTLVQFDAADDGGLTNRRFLSGKPNIPGCDGVAFDEKGDIYVAGRAQGAVHVYSPGNVGPFLGHIWVKGSPNANGNNTNQIFGGPDGKTLFITGNGGCFKMPMKVAGRKRPVSSTALLRMRPARSRAFFSLGIIWDISGRTLPGAGLGR